MRRLLFWDIFQMGKAFAFKKCIGYMRSSTCCCLFSLSNYYSRQTAHSRFRWLFRSWYRFCNAWRAVLDGTEILAIYLTRQSSLSVGDVILGFNIVGFLWQRICQH